MQRPVLRLSVLDYGMILLAAAFASAWCGAWAALPTGGTISIEPRNADGEYDPATSTFVNAAGEALAARGFTILEDPGHSAYVAELILSRAEVGTGTAKAATGKALAGPGGAGGSVGVGVVIPLSTGKSRLVPLVRTRLELRLHKRGEADAVWDGTATTVRAAGTAKGADAAVAADLVAALLRTYPAEPEGIVGVP